MPDGKPHNLERSDSFRRLCRVVTAQCRGSTSLWGQGNDRLCEALESRGIEAAICGPGASDLVFDTVVVARALEYAPESAGGDILEEAWRRVAPRGRLLVCVPNEDCLADPQQLRIFRRRGLKKLLKPFGKPKLVTSQPFKWLVMYVDADRPLPRTVMERYDIVAELCHGRVIELGCGRGDLVRTVADLGLEVTGVDISESKVAQARDKSPDSQFILADILELPADDRGYDTVILAEVLEHVAEDMGSRMLSKAWELVAPGGRLIVSVPYEDCIPHPNHITQFSRQSLESLLERFAPPRLVTEQPFKWLMMYVDRSR